MKFRKLAIAVVGAMLATGAVSMSPAQAESAGDSQGCTPGYWKNHTSKWQEYSPSTTLAHMLRTQGGTDYTFPAALSSYGSLTMLQGLQLKGGPDAAGGAEILLRAGVAAYLNAAYDVVPGGSQGLFYPYRRFSVTVFNGVTYQPLQPSITAALNTVSKAPMVALASQLDAANNLGCPLS